MHLKLFKTKNGRLTGSRFFTKQIIRYGYDEVSGIGNIFFTNRTKIEMSSTGKMSTQKKKRAGSRCFTRHMIRYGYDEVSVIGNIFFTNRTRIEMSST